MSGLAVGSLYALIALGFNLTFAVNGTVNMGQGHAVMLGGMLMYTFVQILSIPFFLSLMIVGVLVGLYGILVELVAVRRFAQDPNAVGWVLSTLALAIIIQDVALYFWGPAEHLLPSPVGGGRVEILGAGIFWRELILLPIVGLVLVFLLLFYSKSHWGLWLRATADNRLATSMMGINSNFVVATAFMLSGILAGLAGGLLSPINAVFAAMGLPIALTAIAVAIVGGLNSAKGIIIAGLGLGVLQVLIATFVSTALRDIIVYFLVILVLFIKPTGIFGEKAVTKV